MKLNLNLTPRTYFIAAGVMFAAGAGLCWMLNSSNGEQERVVESLRKDLREEAQVQKELDDAIKKVDEISKKLEHLERGVPDYAYNATLLKELQNFGVSNKVSILQVKPVIAPKAQKQEGERKKPFEELNIVVKARGTYGDAMRFVGGLKSFPKVIAIRTLSITPRMEVNQDERAIPLLDVDLELRAFLFKGEMKRTKAPEDTEPKATAAKSKKGVAHES